ncbi:MAG: hypothetical protein HZB36_00975 [Candidatus Omnitrophica bacterium]|nr:hypothetical protein [Candidatus Omnitrophota bacterium]
MKVKLEWEQGCCFWIMKDFLGRFMQELRDCYNLRMMFPDANKNKINIYEIEAAKKVAECDPEP